MRFSSVFMCVGFVIVVVVSIKDFMAFYIAFIRLKTEYWMLKDINYIINIIRWFWEEYFPLGQTKWNENGAFDWNAK